MILFTLTGNYFTRRDSERVKIIEEILLMIQIISSEIRYSKTALNVIVHKLSENRGLARLEFLSRCRKMLESEAFPQSWKTSVEKSQVNYEERVLLLSFGAGLGTSDVEGQLSNCELHKALFENNLQNAREQSNRFGKLYTSLGVLGGILAALIIV